MSKQKQLLNYEFYSNKIASTPNGALIDEIHFLWFGDYSKLEEHHVFSLEFNQFRVTFNVRIFVLKLGIFPSCEESFFNSKSQILTKEEAELIKSSPELQKRVITSYRMMLDFYGLELEDEETGKVKRSNIFEERYKNLNKYSHNNMRITRILKSLGELGFEHLKKPLVQHFANELLENNYITKCLESLMNFWVKTLSKEDQNEFETLFEKHSKKIKKLLPKKKFVREPIITRSMSKKRKRDFHL